MNRSTVFSRCSRVFSVMHRSSLLISCMAFTVILFSCQHPIETPPEIVRTVTVLVIDSAHTPMKDIPVEAYRVPTQLLTTGVTGIQGTVAFRLSIPQSGGAYRFTAGSATTGRASVEANLLCRDTTVIIILTSASLPCGLAIIDSVRFTDVCARSSTGVEYPDSTERRYCSTCDVPLTMQVPTLSTPARLTADVFDHNGTPVRGAFTLPPRGCFSIRVRYVPQTVGTVNEQFLVTGSGANNASLRLDLRIAGNAIDCNQCLCGDSITVIDLGDAVVGGSDSVRSDSRMVNQNKSTCVRSDRLIEDFRIGSPFSRGNAVTTRIPPNGSQPLVVIFTARSTGAQSDTLVYETQYDNGRTCRHTVIVRARGVQAACCLDPVASSAGLVVTSTTPRVDTLHLTTRIYQSIEGRICFRNCGTGGTASVSSQLAQPAPGFSSSPQQLTLRFGAPSECFTIRFNADTSIARPNGIGGPAKTRHEADLQIAGCLPQRVHVVVDLDTLPVLFSNCIYRWSQNSLNGYNFTPPENKGSFVFDPNGDNASMLSDFTLMSIGSTTATVRVRSGWAIIQLTVPDQADFTYEKIKAWPSFPLIMNGPFNAQQEFTMTLWTVYSIRVVRGGQTQYALVRVREISTDGQKEKICFDVYFPM